jgi:hypothetical protein
MAEDFDRNYSGIQIDVVIQGEKYASDLNLDLLINDSLLEEEFIDQPRKFAWWAAVEILARDQFEVKKTQLKRLYAVIDKRTRDAGVESGKKLTEKMVENTVLTDLEYQKAENELGNIKKQYNFAHVGKEAFEQRKEMLISLGANYRAEITADPTIVKEKEKIRAERVKKQRDMIKKAEEKAKKKESEKAELTKKPVGKKPVGKLKKKRIGK